MQPPCMLNVVQFTAFLLAHLLACVCLAKLWSTERPRKFCSRAWFEIDWQNVVSSRTVRLCRDFALTRCGTFPQVYRGTKRCCSTRTMSSTISGSFVKRQRKRPGHIVLSVRVVPCHLIGSYRFIWSRLLNADTPSEQFIALLDIVRRRSRSLSIHAGRSCFVVNIRLTARLQSLPLARCWRACFVLLVLFSPFCSV